MKPNLSRTSAAQKSDTGNENAAPRTVPRLYAIGDLHLSSTDSYTEDVFRGYDHWKTLLEENWRRVVKSSDTVVLAGDTSFAKTLDEATADFAFLEGLPGRKILIKGNHDSYWGTTAKLNNFKASNGFDSINFLKNNHFAFGEYAICGTRGYDIALPDDESRKILEREHGRLALSLKSAAVALLKPIVFTHFPPIMNFETDREAIAIMKNFGVKKCFYGHLHGENAKNAFIGEKSGINFGIISADSAKFIPVFIQ
jgi:predicted phosphohydrolase